MTKTILLILTLILPLQGCIFIPLYYKSVRSPTNFEVGSIPERRGQMLRNLLREKLCHVPSPTDTTYQVAVSLSKTHEAAGYNTDLTTTITRVNLVADVTLTPSTATKPLFLKVQVADFFINALSTYAVAKAEEDVEHRLIVILADAIVTKISAAIKSKHAICD